MHTICVSHEYVLIINTAIIKRKKRIYNSDVWSTKDYTGQQTY